MKKAVLVGVRYTRFNETYRTQVKGMEQPPLGAYALLPTPHKDCDTMTRLLIGKQAVGWWPIPATDCGLLRRIWNRHLRF